MLTKIYLLMSFPNSSTDYYLYCLAKNLPGQLGKQRPTITSIMPKGVVEMVFACGNLICAKNVSSKIEKTTTRFKFSLTGQSDRTRRSARNFRQNVCSRTYATFRRTRRSESVPIRTRFGTLLTILNVKIAGRKCVFTYVRT